MSCAVRDRLRVAGSSAWVDPWEGRVLDGVQSDERIREREATRLATAGVPTKGSRTDSGRPFPFVAVPSTDQFSRAVDTRSCGGGDTHPLLLPSDAMALQLTAEPQTTNRSVRGRASTPCPSGPRGLDDVAARTERHPRGIRSYHAFSVRRRPLGESSVAEGNRTGG
jgi:hypothetical protein